MKYMVLIYQGTTPLPGTPEWDSLAQEQKDAVVSGYRNLNQATGVTPGEHMQPPEMATTVRVHGGGTLTTDGPSSRSRRPSAVRLHEADVLMPSQAGREGREHRAALSRCARWWGDRPSLTASSVTSGGESSLRSSASSATSTSPRKLRRRPSPSRPSGGRATAFRRTRVPGSRPRPETGPSTASSAIAR